MRSLMWKAGAFVAGLVLSAGVSFAHAALRHAVPAAGAVLSESPDELTIEFSEAVDQARVELRVTAEEDGGTAIDLTEPEAQPATGALVRRQIAAKLGAGAYHVFWRVISVDGHWTRGDYSFEVKP